MKIRLIILLLKLLRFFGIKSEWNCSPKGFKSRTYEFWITTKNKNINLRINPKEFQLDLNNLSNLIDLGDVRELKKFRLAYETAIQRWGEDPELIRLYYLQDFMNETPQCEIVES